jgi:hypothetical protein
MMALGEANSDGVLHRISMRESGKLLRSARRGFDVPDVGGMIHMKEECKLVLSGQQLADDLRAFANGVESLPDALEQARGLAAYLQAISARPPNPNEQWKGLAVFCFWTMRNAIQIWNSAMGERPLRAHPLKWCRVPAHRQAVRGINLGIKLGRMVYVHGDDFAIFAPEWFLAARSQSYPRSEEPHEKWAPLARAVATQYVQLAVASATMSEAERFTDAHPSLTQYFKQTGASNTNGCLSLGGMFRDLESTERPAGITPGKLIWDILDNMKNEFRNLPEWAFIPWKQTLWGLIPFASMEEFCANNRPV